MGCCASSSVDDATTGEARQPVSAAVAPPLKRFTTSFRLRRKKQYAPGAKGSDVQAPPLKRFTTSFRRRRKKQYVPGHGKAPTVV